MTNKKSTKRALLSSFLAICLCLSMFVGTTFAWFTDSVTSATNIIKSGNLDVDLLYWDNSMPTGTQVSLSDEPELPLFKNVDGEAILWEPGAQGLGQFEVVNKGSLALKYQFEINFFNATETAPGSGKTLADVLSIYAIARRANGGEDNVMEDPNLNSLYTDAYVPGYEAQPLKDFMLEGYLLPGESFRYELGLFWEPTDNDNEYNVEGGLSAEFGITLVATQKTYEKDSFDDQYDADSLSCDVLATPATINEILATVEEGTIIGLSAGKYGSLKMTQNNLTLVSNTAVVDYIDLNGCNNITIDGITFDANGAKVPVNGNNYAYYNNIADDSIRGGTGAKAGVYNVVIKNCTFTAISRATVPADKYIPVHFYEQGRSGVRAHDVTIDNCVFACDALQYIKMDYMSAGTVKLSNNVFGSLAYGTTHNTINASGNSSNFIITGNEFYNWNPANAAFGSSYQGSFVNIVVTDNQFINTADETTFNVLNIKTSYKDTNSALKVENNSYNYGKFTYNETPVTTADGKDNLYQMTADKALGLEVVLDNAKPGETVNLDAGKDYGTVKVGELKDVVINGASDASVIFTTDANTKIENVTIQGAGFEYTGATADCGVVIDANAQIDNLVIDGCTISGTGAKAGRGLSGYNNNATIVLKNCTFEDIGYPIYAWGSFASLTIDNCTFKNIKSWAIMPQSGFDGDLTVTNCKFIDCQGGGLIKAGTLTAGHTFTFTNNTITNCSIAGDHNWFQFNTSAGTTVIENNKMDGQPWTPSAADGLK